MLGIYVHIPFCIKKCNYCDFNSRVASNYEDYVRALVAEINAFPLCLDVDTIYFGGGTPTLVPLGGILEAIFKNFNVKKDAEISVETNPKVFEDFRSLRNMGANRLSMGLQSVHDDELRFLGRAYNFEEFKSTYSKARREFENINLDIMFSLPDQTMEKWMETVETVRGFAPEHISCYALKVEEGTPFANMQLNLPDDEVDRQMYWYACSSLSSSKLLDNEARKWALTLCGNAELSNCEQLFAGNQGGYERYEISNFAKKGYECRHNLKYWRREEYIGFGSGAHSFFNGERWCNSRSLEKWNAEECEKLAKIDALREYVFLGLRLSEGINMRKLNGYFDREINESIQEGLLSKEGDILTLTNKGIDLSNQVFIKFF